MVHRHCYQQQGKKVILMKPDMDIRFGKETVKSRHKRCMSPAFGFDF